MAYQESAQAFVRALRAPADPPAPGDPPKIDIASAAWHAEFFYVPRKAEIVFEWCLTRILKEGMRESAATPVLDVRYWELLHETLLSANTVRPKGDSLSNTWLRPLLNRIPLLPVVLSLLSNAPNLSLREREEIYLQSSRLLALTWSLASPKFTVDTLLECFGAVLSALEAERAEYTASSGLAAITALVTTSLHTALFNSMNKKKLTQTFTKSHLGTWLHLLSGEDTHTAVIDLGVDLLFNADTLKQIAESPRDSPLFEALRAHTSTSQLYVLSVLPRLMAAFTQAVKRRRSLFASGSSSSADVRALALSFFSACEEILQSVGTEDARVWRSRRDLLRVVEAEFLFDVGQEDTTVLLKEIAEDSIKCLISTEGGSLQVALQCLCALSCIDHDLVEPFTSRILSGFLHIPQSRCDVALIEPAHEFLSLALSYHSKTRTLPLHISRLAESCTLAPSHPSYTAVKASYDDLVASPTLVVDHLDKLSKAVRSFITPGQTLETARKMTSVLQDLWEAFRHAESAAASDHGQGVRKKRRTSEGTEKAAGRDAHPHAVTLALTARIVAVVLSSLPLHSVTEPVQADVRATVAEFMESFAHEAIVSSIDAVTAGVKDRRRDVWAAQVVAAVALRLRYILPGPLHLQLDPSGSNGLEELLSGLTTADDCLPEFRIEIFRYLMQRRGHDRSQQALFDAALGFLEANLPASESASVSWSGRSAQLNSGKDGVAFAAVALLRLILDRNIEGFNAFASSAQHERLMTAHGLSLSAVVHECLHSANFWEQGNIRSSLFDVLNAKTAFLDAVDAKLSTSKSAKKRASAEISAERAEEALKAYTILLYAPSEYLQKNTRNDFLRRAVVLDLLLGLDIIVSWHGALPAVRTFLARTFSSLNSWEHQTGGVYLHHLITSQAPASAEQATEDLIRGHLSVALRAASHGSSDVIVDTIRLCRKRLSGAQPALKEPEAPIGACARQLMEIAVADFPVSSFSQDILDHLSSLLERVVELFHPAIQRLVSHEDEILDYSHALVLWSRAITFGRYLGSSDAPLPGLGARALQTIVPLLPTWDPADARCLGLAVAVHAILTSELQILTEESEREIHLQRIIVAYIIFANFLEPAERHDLDDTIKKLFRTLSPSEFASCLQLALEPLSSSDVSAGTGACLIHLMSTALHDAPENTLKVTQAHVKDCLEIFSNTAELCDSPTVRLPMLSFINSLCSKRPASVQPQNVVSIWVVLSRSLAGSRDHDPETSTDVFHVVISILSALVRLRRDLVVITLPHLSGVIRQLVSALRSPRPLLGAKQHAIVADSLPAWINPSHPLGVEQSKDLARLLTTLSTKTLIRVHGPSAELQKPESLARPLSKHVAYILQAYLDVLNDPLCILAADVRRELLPGLFVLCEMLNEHARDALMVSLLDAGGKAAMKALWREYEKQRYVGKG
ncbi:Urb2/Npa2 family-domain-containing protein [Gloeopeniophorella convolvens]|nr:Urb2/Npa2 family-domain-containing protein [Gloeopeniophorella convolvens]